MVYLSMDHVGFGSPEGGSRKQRVWLRFQNNCGLPIDLQVNGAPTDTPDDGLTIMYEFVVPISRGVEVTEGGRLPERKRVTPPPDTMSEVGSIHTVLPGQGVLFSVPATHLSRDWEIHIPFRFRLPRGKGLRDENVWGGEPEMFLAYTFWDLPPSIQKGLELSFKSQLSVTQPQIPQSRPVETAWVFGNFTSQLLRTGQCTHRETTGSCFEQVCSGSVGGVSGMTG
jgi:hypothetical protein